MSRSRCLRLALVVPLCAFACAHAGGLAWDGARPEDPEPSGPEYLRSYKESHYRALGDGWAEGATLEDWLEQAAKSEVVFLGDHHEDFALHARMLIALEDLAVRSGRRIALGLEAIGVDDEVAVRHFLRRRYDMPTLRRDVRSRWPESWLDAEAIDAGFYRSVLEFAQEHNVPIFALEPTPRLPLYSRDAEITDRIRLARALMPNRLLVVIVGHAHLLGPGKLVARTGMRSMTVGARMSRSLAANPPESGAEFLRTNSGIWFFRETGTRTGRRAQTAAAFRTVR